MIIHSLYYHNPDPNGFEKMVKYHKRHGYRFISVEELYDLLSTGIPIKEKLAFISFDDGWQGNLRLLPIIEKYNVPICIFVTTEPLVSGNFWWEYVVHNIGYVKMLDFKKLPLSEFYQRLVEYKQHTLLQRSAMTIDNLVTLSHSSLVSIQAHTVNHPILTSCPDVVLENELADSKSTLRNLTGKNVFAFSYPNGCLTSREIEAAKKHYALAFTTEQKHISTNDNLYTLPRYALTGQYCRDLLKIWGVWKRLKCILRR
jgi:peptidoglycan/xylan/chitin deacetylase (PgdA/CDA1 family)